MDFWGCKGSLEWILRIVKDVWSTFLELKRSRGSEWIFGVVKEAWSGFIEVGKKCWSPF